MDPDILILGVVVFGLRVIDVATGTLRTLTIVQGRTWLSFFLGLIEVTLWIYVVSAILPLVTEEPLLVVFYALGFSTGNVAGLWLERRLAMGDIILRLITHQDHLVIQKTLRERGFNSTLFTGEGGRGKINEIFLVCPRRKMTTALNIAREFQPDIFYISQTPGQTRPILSQGGWLSVLKRK